MADCAFLLDAYTTAIGRASHADAEIVRLQEEQTMLTDLVETVEGLISEQEAFIQSVTDQMAKLIADRIEDIDAVDARIAEIIARLDGGADRPPAEGEERRALEDELLELLDLFETLVPERELLAAGQTDGTTLEAAIDGFTEARTDATELLDQMRSDKTGFENRLTENGTQQETESGTQNDANNEAERIFGLATGAGCDWATGETPPGPPSNEDPETDPEEPETDPEEPDQDEPEPEEDEPEPEEDEPTGGEPSDDEPDDDEPTDEDPVEDEPTDADQPVEDDDFEDEP